MGQFIDDLFHDDNEVAAANTVERYYARTSALVKGFLCVHFCCYKLYIVCVCVCVIDEH